MKKAWAYVRLSKDEPGSVSMDYQESEIRKVCDREGLSLERVVKDNGISGKSISNRAGIQEVLKAVDRQEVDAVVCYKSDRLSRDGLESLKIEALCLRRSVILLSATEGNLSADSVDEEFMRFIRAGLNQRERKLIGMRTSQALQRKKEKGEHVGRPRYGYHVQNGRLVPNVAEQAVIQRILGLKAQGLSTRSIAATLKDDGVTTRSGGQWSQTQVCRILKAQG